LDIPMKENVSVDPDEEQEIVEEVIVPIPDWIKNNAGWWSDGAINDDSFIQGIQFLIKEKILNISSSVIEYEGDAKIPQWVKNNAAWWSEGVTSEEDFLNGIEYLIKNGIIQLQ